MKNSNEVRELIEICGENLVRLLQRLGALYVRLKRGDKGVSCVVGRKSTYTNPDKPSEQLPYVSENYYNGQVLMLYPIVVKHLAKILLTKAYGQVGKKLMKFQGIGPRGELLANFMELQAEEEKPKLKSLFSFDNGEERIVLVQDILDPLSLSKTLEESSKAGKRIYLICCIINPDSFYTDYVATSRGPITLVSLIKEILTKYPQHHPVVEEAVNKDNVIWDPQNEWDKLAKIMEENDLNEVKEKKAKQMVVV